MCVSVEVEGAMCHPLSYIISFAEAWKDFPFSFQRADGLANERRTRDGNGRCVPLKVFIFVDSFFPPFLAHSHALILSLFCSLDPYVPVTNVTCTVLRVHLHLALRPSTWQLPNGTKRGSCCNPLGVGVSSACKQKPTRGEDAKCTTHIEKGPTVRKDTLRAETVETRQPHALAVDACP